MPTAHELMQNFQLQLQARHGVVQQLKGCRVMRSHLRSWGQQLPWYDVTSRCLELLMVMLLYCWL